MYFKVFISLFDHADTSKIIAFFRRRKFTVSNLIEDELLYDPKTSEDKEKFPCIAGVYTDNFSLGGALGLELYKYPASDSQKIIDKIISDLKASSFPYFMAVAFNSEGYWAVDHGHLISKANNHVEVKKVTEIVEVVEEIVKEVEAKPKKAVKKIAKKAPARKAKLAPKAAIGF